MQPLSVEQVPLIAVSDTRSRANDIPGSGTWNTVIDEHSVPRNPTTLQMEPPLAPFRVAIIVMMPSPPSVRSKIASFQLGGSSEAPNPLVSSRSFCIGVADL